MRRTLATIKKDLLVLSRDRGGLAILFLMPMALVVIMAMIQDAPFRDFQENKIPVLVVDNDEDTLGHSIIHGMSNSSVFVVHQELDGQKLTEKKVRKLTQQGNYKIGIVIPAGATERVREKAYFKVGKALGIGAEEEPLSDSIPVTFTLFFDPVTKSSFKNSVRHSLDKFVTQMGSGMLLQALSDRLQEAFPGMEEPDVAGTNDPLFQFKEVHAGGQDVVDDDLRLNSVQHNVPAWTVFGMFFIVITMAGNMIREKNEGSDFRLRVMPGSYMNVIAGKVGAYLLVCLIQCALMIAVGIFLFPALGLPAFKTGQNILGVLLVALATGTASTGFGVFVGTIFTTHQQASTFGAVAVVLLAAIGGVWVPLYIMPDIMKTVGNWSPLNWGLSAFNGIFVRGSGILGVLPDVIKLFGFSALAMLGAFLYDRSKTA